MVASTLAAHSVVLVFVLILCRQHGLQIDRGVYLISIALFSVCFGLTTAILCFAVLIVAVVASEALISEKEKRVVTDRAQKTLQKVLGTNP